MRNQLHADYYQAKIQIRPYNEEIVRFINNQVRKDKNVFVSKILRYKNGVDFFVSSNKFARIVGKKLKKSFKGELIESVKLHTRDRIKSKNLYRVTVCFRLNPFEKSPNRQVDGAQLRNNSGVHGKEEKS
ncbi:hypothetical protein HYV88_04415 [Candidatus Woesearchaeota archaeon]|nr:hypothetical protein [Candidatus Woesearchaeota archaeon]